MASGVAERPSHHRFGGKEKEAREGTVGAGERASRVPASAVGAGLFWRLTKQGPAKDRRDAMEPKGSDRARRVPRGLFFLFRRRMMNGPGN